jgi:hypothetical protein
MMRLISRRELALAAVFGLGPQLLGRDICRQRLSGRRGMPRGGSTATSGALRFSAGVLASVLAVG